MPIHGPFIAHLYHKVRLTRHTADPRANLTPSDQVEDIAMSMRCGMKIPPDALAAQGVLGLAALAVVVWLTVKKSTRGDC